MQRPRDRLSTVAVLRAQVSAASGWLWSAAEFRSLGFAFVGQGMKFRVSDLITRWESAKGLRILVIDQPLR